TNILPPSWLISALRDLTGESGKKMKKELFEGMVVSHTAALTLRMRNSNCSPTKLDLHREKVPALNFRTMAEATIYQMTTNSGSDGFMKLRNELWLFQIHLTLDID